MQILYALFLGAWRRWFGGGLDFLLDNRFLKHVVGFIAACCILYYNGYNWLQIVTGSIALQGLFWAIGHGDYFAVNHTGKDEGRIKCIDWALRKLYGVDGYYNFKGNVTGMFLRYEPPAILLSVILCSFWPILCGLGVTLAYALMGKMFPQKSYTEYAEYLAGFLVGIFLM